MPTGEDARNKEAMGVLALKCCTIMAHICNKKTEDTLAMDTNLRKALEVGSFDDWSVKSCEALDALMVAERKIEHYNVWQL